VAGRNIETKLIFKSDTDQAAKNIIKLEQEMDRLIAKMKTVSDTPFAVSGRGRATGGAGRAGRAGGGVTGGETVDEEGNIGGRRVRATRGSPRGDSAPATTPVMPLSTPALSPSSPISVNNQSRFRNFMQGVGYAGGVAGGVMGAATGSMIPAVGGALMAAGGAAMGLNIFGVPVGAAIGPAMMAAGGLLQIGNIAAQPAAQHYGALAPTYRRLGAEKSKRARDIAVKTGAYTPSEAIQLAGKMQGFGGFEGMGVMARMRYGGYETEFMQPSFEKATKVGAFGNRVGQTSKQDYEFLGKILATAFGKETKLASMGQAIETMTGLMGLSEQHLADLGPEGTKTLAGLTRWMEMGNTSVLKGQRGVQTMGGIYNAIATPGTPAKEMFMWGALGQGGNYFDFLRKRGDPKSIMPVLEQLSRYGPEFGAMALSNISNIPFLQAEAVMKAYKDRESPEAIQAKLDKGSSAVGGTNIDFKPTKELYDKLTTLDATLEAKKLGISETVVATVKGLEVSLTSMAASAFELAKVPDILRTMQQGVDKMNSILSGTGDVPKPPVEYVQAQHVGLVPDYLVSLLKGVFSSGKTNQ